ncbi:MAG: hypothetical protein AAF532_09530 [Planctomycetota bacterium]
MTATPAEQDFSDEAALVDATRAAVSRCNWFVGRCASEWTERYAAGRTDTDFAALVGLSSDQVYQRRRVWETFGGRQDSWSGLRWSHFYVALTWEDAETCLDWAAEHEATVAEMRAWRRLHRDEHDPADEFAPDAFGGDPTVTEVHPVRVEVRDPAEFGDGGGHGDTDGPPFTPTGGREEVAVAAHRATGDDDTYAPFRADAAKVPTAGGGPDEKARPEAVAARLVSTFVRIDKALTPAAVEAIADLPEPKRVRMLEAFGQIATKLGGLRRG